MALIWWGVSKVHVYFTKIILILHNGCMNMIGLNERTLEFRYSWCKTIINLR